jgi:hypothetical protein
MLRSIAARREHRCFHIRTALRCVSKHEGTRPSRPHPSRRAHTRSSLRQHFRMRAPQDEDEHRVSAQLTMSNSPSRSRGAFLRPGFAPLLHSPPVEGWAERRETFGCSAEHPWGLHMTRHARRLARRLASHNAGRSPLGAPPWRFWAPGAALPSPSAPAVLQRRAVAFRIRAASSSHPGRSAWRAGSLPPGANGYEPPPQDATPRSAFRIVSRTRPQ